MSVQANLVVYDGASTPVGHTLQPVSNKMEGDTWVVTYRELLPTLPDQAQVTAVIRQRTLKSGVVRTEWDVSFPVMESVSGQNAAGYTAAPAVAYVDRNVWTNFRHPRSTPTSRKIARMPLVNIMNNVVTSTAAASAGPGPESIDSGILPN